MFFLLFLKKRVKRLLKSSLEPLNASEHKKRKTAVCWRVFHTPVKHMNTIFCCNLEDFFFLKKKTKIESEDKNKIKSLLSSQKTPLLLKPLPLPYPNTPPTHTIGANEPLWRTSALWRELGSWILIEFTITHFCVFDIQLPLSPCISVQATKASPPLISLSSLHFSSMLFRRPPLNGKNGWNNQYQPLK